MGLRKYKLQDLVTKGSYARRKVDSDLLVGDISAGYGYGDILDANATSQLIGEKVTDLHIENINETIAKEVSDLKEKDKEHDEKLAYLRNGVTTKYNEALGHLTISIFQNKEDQ